MDEGWKGMEGGNKRRERNGKEERVREKGREGRGGKKWIGDVKMGSGCKGKEGKKKRGRVRTEEGENKRENNEK